MLFGGRGDRQNNIAPGPWKSTENSNGIHHNNKAEYKSGIQFHGRMTNICVSKLRHYCSDNGLSPVQRQAIFWTNAGLFLIGTNGKKYQGNLNHNITISKQESLF